MDRNSVQLYHFIFWTFPLHNAPNALQAVLLPFPLCNRIQWNPRGAGGGEEGWEEGDNFDSQGDNIWGLKS